MGMAGYGTKALPKGEGMGVACVSSQERATASWTACVAHVAVAPSGEVKVKKLTVATDVGTQVHPDNIRAQVEGAALWGLSLAMYEKATLKDGGIEQLNFDSYTPLRMSQVPEIAINVIANGDKASGVGEPAVTVVAPALGNAPILQNILDRIVSMWKVCLRLHCSNGRCPTEAREWASL